jgi:DNA polymerase-3 subunit delta
VPDVTIAAPSGATRSVSARSAAGGSQAGPGSARADHAADAALLGPVVLLLGDEELLVSRGFERVIAAARRADPATELTERVGSAVEPVELYELLSPSLFGGRRVVSVRSAHDLRAAAIDVLASLLAAPADELTVVLHHPGGVKGKAVLELARRLGAPQLACARLTRQDERLDFVRGEVRRAGGTITPDAAAALLDAVGSDLRELAAVAAQLVSDSGGPVDADVVASYHEGRAEVSGFAVADLVVSGEPQRALEALRWALAVGVPQVVIADALADGVRSVARVSAAGRGNPNELAPRLGMPPWKVRRAQSQARGWTERGLRRALGVVALLNADVKGVAVDADYALERAIGQLAQARTMR